MQVIQDVSKTRFIHIFRTDKAGPKGAFVAKNLSKKYGWGDRGTDGGTPQKLWICFYVGFFV